MFSTSALQLQNMATTKCAGIQQQSTKSNATTQEKCTQETHNKISKLECNNASMMQFKRSSTLARNRTLVPNTFHTIPFCKSITNEPTWRNNLPHHLARQPNQCGQNIRCQKPCPCSVPKRKMQFSNNPNPTHNFMSTLTMKSVVPVDTDPISMGM